MKEGELMKEKNELDVLENAEQSVIERLTAEYPPRDEKEKEKIFSMSERKCKNRSDNIIRNEEQTVSGVEVYKRPRWQRFLSVAAAFAIVVGGVAGGAYAYRQFRNNETAFSEADKKIAPFGDFAKLNYQLCDYSKEPIVNIVELDKGTEHDGNDDVMEEEQIKLPGGTPISQDKREKLADFFNNYDYKYMEHTIFNPENKTYGPSDKAPDAPEFKDYPDELAKAILETPDPSEIELEEPEIEGMTVGENLEPQMPYFICDDSNEIRMISIYRYDGIGCLAYFKMEYEEKDGRFVYEDFSSVEMMGWEIDFDYFKSTITAILNDEDYTLRDTSGQSDINENIAPFGNFSEKEYRSLRTEEASLFIQADDYSLGLEQGKEIPFEKRKELEEFFNSQEWKESDKTAYTEYTPFWLQTMEYLNFAYITDDELNIIWLDRDSGTLSYTTVKIEKDTDDDTKYKCIEPHSKSDVKVYDIDYDLFAAKIREILGDEFSDKTHEYNNFAAFRWTVEDTDRALLEDERKAVYDVISKCDWTTKQPENNTDSEQQDNDSIVLYHEKGSEHVLLSFETFGDYTHVGYAEYTYKESGEYTPDDVNVMESYYCDDATIVQRIKECIAEDDAKNGIKDFSFINEYEKVNVYYVKDDEAFIFPKEKAYELRELFQNTSWSEVDKEDITDEFDLKITGLIGDRAVLTEVGKDKYGYTVISYRDVVIDPFTLKIDVEKTPYKDIWLRADKDILGQIEKIFSE